jgi:hypothetical protein
MLRLRAQLLERRDEYELDQQYKTVFVFRARDLHRAASNGPGTSRRNESQSLLSEMRVHQY